ncbi:MAG: hypothetical protein ABR552_05615, partial [Actinomycetota bacterium]
DASFAPCPAYTESIADLDGKVAASYSLTCDGAESVRAGSSVTFEMNLTLPAGIPAGNGRLVWQLGDVNATSPLTVTN